MIWPGPSLDLVKLTEDLRTAQGTLIAFAIVDSASLRQTLINELRRSLHGEVMIQEIRLTPQVPSLPRLLEEQTPTEERVAFFVYCFEELFDKPREQAILSLNLKREALGRCNAPVVIWLAAESLVDIARWAPDFFAWRSSIYEFRTVKGVYDESNLLKAKQTYSASLAPAKELIEKARLFQDMLLRELAQTEPNYPIVANIRSTLTQINEELSQWSQARRFYEKDMEIWKQLDTASINALQNRVKSMEKYFREQMRNFSY